MYLERFFYEEKEIVDDVTMKRAITRITYEIIERNKNLDKIVLAGIKTRGVYIAQRIQERLKQLENLDVPLIELDTKAFRDDVKAEQDTSVFLLKLMERMLSLWMMCFTQVVLSVQLLTISLAMDVQRVLVWLSWLTVVTVNCQSVRTMLVKISQLVSQKKSKFW